MEPLINLPVDIARIFLECFDGSARELFQRCLSRHPHIRKWMIGADFCLHNKDRPMDCFVFTVLPYDDWPARIENDVKRAVPRDIKKTKDLDEKAAEWLRDPRRFHFAITVNKDRNPFYNGPGSNVRKVAREHVDLTLKALASHGSDEDTLKRVKELSAKAQSNGFNVALLADIWLLGIWFAVITIVIGRERPSEIVGWFPDRDDMTNWCGGIWQNYAHWNCGAFAEAFAVDLRNTRVAAGAPDRTAALEIMWFDYMIRAADWLAGSLAAWDRTKNAVPGDQPKYLKMIENVIADAENIVLLHLDLKNGAAQFRRINVTSSTSTKPP
jgi:hypothetical protein